VTVAAEQGVVGLAVYLALLIAALLRLLRGSRRRPARAALAAAFVALAAHTWIYAAFLEDPTTWALLAIGAALATGREGPAEANGAAGGGARRRASRNGDGAAKPGAVPAAASPPAL
jgi:O-antigen ligase